MHMLRKIQHLWYLDQVLGHSFRQKLIWEVHGLSFRQKQIIRDGPSSYGCTSKLGHIYADEKPADVDMFQKSEKVYPACSQNLLS